MGSTQTTIERPTEHAQQPPRSAWAHVGVPLALALLGLLAFLPGIGAGFVSDSFYFLWTAHVSSFADMLGHFVPAANTWYRPLTDLVFWLEYQVFGQNPVGYHLIALLFHIASAILLYFVSLRLTGNRFAALLAGLVLLLTIHAQEVVWDVGDLHSALGGAVLLACLLAYVHGRNLWH